MTELTVDRFTTDKAFYAALKLHVYGTVHDSFLTTLLGGRSILLNESLRLEVGRFTARKANHMFVGENGNRPTTSAEFFGFTSHKVREKLLAMSDTGVLELLGKGLRDAYTYRWRIPVKHWEICSYMRFRPLTLDDPSMSLELYRLYFERAFDPFTFHDFHDVYARAHGEEYEATRWGKRKFEKIASSFAYEQFLKGRFEKLVHRKLLVPAEETPESAPAQAPGRHDLVRLNPRIRDELHHLDLFMNAVAFHPSRDMCRVCPLDSLCQGGATQRLIVALNHTPVAPPKNGASPGPPG